MLQLDRVLVEVDQAKLVLLNTLVLILLQLDRVLVGPEGRTSVNWSSQVLILLQLDRVLVVIAEQEPQKIED